MFYHFQESELTTLYYWPELGDKSHSFFIGFDLNAFTYWGAERTIVLEANCKQIGWTVKTILVHSDR